MMTYNVITIFCEIVGDFSKPYPEEKIQIATKFAPFPWCTKPTDVVKACQKSLARLGRPSIDLYQIHWPNAYCNAEYWDGLAMAYGQGLVKAVGVSNYGVDATRACHAALAKRDIPLATNQIQMSLLYQWPLKNGLLAACDDLGVQVLSYSPLGLGMLAGKYTADNLPSGPRKKIYQNLMTTPDYTTLLATMTEIAAGHGEGATQAQVALNWNRAKGTIPIPGARTVNQIRGNYGALDWTLSADEVKVLDAAASKVTTFIQPDQNPFPTKDKDTGLKMYDS
jgi:pyridoxine 4-dehydrogenase